MPHELKVLYFFASFQKIIAMNTENLFRSETQLSNEEKHFNWLHPEIPELLYLRVFSRSKMLSEEVVLV